MSDHFYQRRTAVTPRAGESIGTAVRLALVLSLERGEPVEFLFNDTLVVVDGAEITASIVETQYNAARGR